MSSSNIFNISEFEKGHVTLHGLERWLCHMYEHLGWMTMAYEHKSYDKVISFINGCQKLKASIQDRHSSMAPSEQKKDVEVLLYKANHLIGVCNKLFDKEELAKKMCEKCESVKEIASVPESAFAIPPFSIPKESSVEDLALKQDAEKYKDKFIMNSRRPSLSKILYNNGVRELTEQIPADFFKNVSGNTLLLKLYYIGDENKNPYTWERYLSATLQFQENDRDESLVDYLVNYFKKKGQGGGGKKSKKVSKKSSKKASKKYSKKGSKLTGGAKKYSKKVSKKASKKRSKKSSKKSKKN